MRLLRLKKRRQFLKVARSGGKVITKSFVVQFSRAFDHQDLLCGITASKRVGKAVVRNRAKRRIRALIPHLWSMLRLSEDILPGLECVLIARKSLLETPYTQLCEEIKKIQLEIIKKIT